MTQTKCTHPEASRWGKTVATAGGARMVPTRCDYCGTVNPPLRSRLADAPVYDV